LSQEATCRCRPKCIQTEHLSRAEHENLGRYRVRLRIRPAPDLSREVLSHSVSECTHRRNQQFAELPPVVGVNIGLLPVGCKAKAAKTIGSMQVQLAPVSTRARTVCGGGIAIPAAVNAWARGPLTMTIMSISGLPCDRSTVKWGNLTQSSYRNRGGCFA
jgi:hypothetical protein